MDTDGVSEKRNNEYIVKHGTITIRKACNNPLGDIVIL